ncbi:hypothetical protein COO60DRAFT_1654904 [Scenedesmus sp. NREL 46B-D3]|nr:hypothetical protein COO60DRAFT_1654904 [Scenedesmus sp. NREL 46B-D3]
MSSEALATGSALRLCSAMHGMHPSQQCKSGLFFVAVTSAAAAPAPAPVVHDEDKWLINKPVERRSEALSEELNDCFGRFWTWVSCGGPAARMRQLYVNGRLSRCWDEYTRFTNCMVGKLNPDQQGLQWRQQVHNARAGACVWVITVLPGPHPLMQSWINHRPVCVAGLKLEEAGKCANLYNVVSQLSTIWPVLTAKEYNDMSCLVAAAGSLAAALVVLAYVLLHASRFAEMLVVVLAPLSSALSSWLASHDTPIDSKWAHLMCDAHMPWDVELSRCSMPSFSKHLCRCAMLVTRESAESNSSRAPLQEGSSSYFALDTQQPPELTAAERSRGTYVVAAVSGVSSTASCRGAIMVTLLRDPVGLAEQGLLDMRRPDTPGVPQDKCRFYFCPGMLCGGLASSCGCSGPPTHQLVLQLSGCQL